MVWSTGTYTLRHAALLYLCSSDACLLYVLSTCLLYVLLVCPPWYWGYLCAHVPQTKYALRCRPPPSEGGGLLLAREIRHLLSLPLSRMGTLGRPHTPAPLLG